MIDAVVGIINNEIVMSLDFCLEGPKGGDPSNIDPNKRKPLIKGSKALEKGMYTTFSEGENPLNTEYCVVYTDMVHTIKVYLEFCKTKPEMKVSCKLPTPELYELSELFVKGNFDIKKINIESTKKTLKGSDFQEKLEKDKSLSIDHKLFFQIVGPPLVREESISSSIGDIKMIRGSLNVEI